MDAAKLFCEHFSSLPDKSGGWHDLVRLAYDEDNDVRLNAVVALVSAFIQVPDKAQAGHDLHRLIQDENGYIVFREMVSREVYTQDLIEIFCLIPNTDEAWQDLHKLTKDDSVQVRFIAAYILSDFFSLAPNKVEAWQDLRRLLIQHNNFGMMEFRVIEITARAIVKNFLYLPDKAQTWQDFVTMAENYGAKRHMRSIAVASLGSVFAHVPDKNQAWQDLIRIASFVGSNGVQIMAAQALGSVFAYVSDKEQAWKDLVKLTENQYRFTRPYAAKTLGRVFIHVQDKNEAWSILHKLAHDSDNIVKSMAIYAIGSAFSSIPDKSGAWGDLIKLTHDVDQFVRMNAYHSLGRACIFKATMAKDNDTLKSELEAAIDYFDKSSPESEYSPAKFCYPFYLSYYAITFKDAKESEVQGYLAKVRRAVGNSRNKDDLLQIVENLARALREAQSQRDRLLQEKISDLNTYRQYCEKAAEYMDAAEVDAPGAVKLMRKCNPLLDERIQAIIAEIQKKAILISPEIERAARCLLLDDPIKAHQCCIRMASALRDSISRLPKEKSELICGILKDIEKGGDFSILLEKLELAMAYTLPAIEAERKEILDRLRNIQFSISNLNISSGSARKDLYELKTSVRSFQDKMAAQELNMEDLGKILKERDYAMIERLENMRNDWLKSVEKMAQDLPSCDDKEEFLMQIRSLKQSQRRDILGITGDISSIAGLFIGLIGLAAL